MIQRIQSLYLLIICVLLTIMFFLPFAVFNDGAGNITYLVYKGVVKMNPSEWISISKNIILTLSLIIPLIFTAITIFLYKNRKNQIILSWLVSFCLLFLSSYIFYYYFWIKSHFGIASSNLNLASIFPIVSIIFALLAIRGIKKDDKLVRSMDRIR